MPKPLAHVTIELRRVLGFTPTTLTGTSDAYLLLRVDNRWVGRTAKIDPAATELSLVGSREFSFDVTRDGPTDVTVQAVLYDDRGDTHALLQDFSAAVEFPWADGTRVFGPAGGLQVECVVTTKMYPSRSPPKVPRGSAGVNAIRRSSGRAVRRRAASRQRQWTPRPPETDR